MLRLRNFTTLLAVLALAACSTFGLQNPKSPEDSLRYGQAVLAGAYTTITQGVQSGSMAREDGRKLFDRLKQPDTDLQAADKVIVSLPKGGTIPSDVTGKITAAVVVLNGIANELRARLPADQTKALPKPLAL